MTLGTAMKRVNDSLHLMGQFYHPHLPIAEIDNILIRNGFDSTEPAIYCGADGRSHEPVGHGKYLHLTWHKMDTGRYEVVAYLS